MADFRKFGLDLERDRCPRRDGTVREIAVPVAGINRSLGNVRGRVRGRSDGVPHFACLDDDMASIPSGAGEGTKVCDTHVQFDEWVAVKVKDPMRIGVRLRPGKGGKSKIAAGL